MSIMRQCGFGVAALVFQGWHFSEHVSLQVQYLTGHYLFGAIKRTSVLLLLRLELHFVHNLLVLMRAYGPINA